MKPDERRHVHDATGARLGALRAQAARPCAVAIGRSFHVANVWREVDVELRLSVLDLVVHVQQ